MPIDVIEKLKGRDSLTPPRSMISFALGGRDFKRKGEEFKNYFLGLVQLKKNDRVLDVGCGIGRMAVPLTSYLSQKGEYWGFDTTRKSIKWCNKYIAARFGNFHFQHIDIYNKVYNPKGKCFAKHLQFPYQSDYFDFVFLISVFTQMLLEDVENYMSEISRVMKPHSRCFITYFLLNNESENLIHEGASAVDFKYKLNKGLTINESEPERSIAYDEDFVRGLYVKYGLRIIEPIHYGYWCGRETFLSYQDIVVATKG
jgi:SAM-dependent methyltransferase